MAGDECVTGSVRLVNTTIDLNGMREGRVEVCVNRAWGTVCGDLFTQSDAAVVCKQLPGFKQEGTYVEAIMYVLTMCTMLLNYRCRGAGTSSR